MSVLYDIQGVQSRAHAERGIARFLLESAAALDRWHPQAIKEFLLNPDHETPGSLEPLTASGRLQFSDRGAYEDVSVLHIGSPVELDVPLHRLWPPAAQAAGLRLIATLYDLIPRLFPDVYLVDPYVRERYETRVNLIRRADKILAISAGTADDAVEHLGVSPDRIVVVGTGVSEFFQPAADRMEALARARTALPEVRRGFLLYTGGIEPRKNIDGLLSGYAQLSKSLRSTHQLVVVCRISQDDRVAIDRRLAELGIQDGVTFTGFVPDEVLLALYQATELFVFPSLYEGFGLPVAEAVACGAPAAVSRIPALTELVREPQAQFDPRDPGSIAATLGQCLTDEGLQQHLRETRLPESATWRGVADRMVAAYADVAKRPQSRRRRRRLRRRIAWVSPLPPQRSGVADDSYRLLAELSHRCDVDAFADGEAQNGEAPGAVSVQATVNFHVAEGRVGGYDRVFYCLGNSEYHAGALTLLRRRPGVVIAHDVRLSGLYGWTAAHRPDLLPEGFFRALKSMYGSRLPPRLGKRGWIDFWDADRHGVLMARQAIARSEQFLVHSRHAAQLARLDAAPGDERKVEVIPFPYFSPEEMRNGSRGEAKPGDPARPIVATFGLVSPAKQTEKLLAAWPFVLRDVPGAMLAIVGSDAGAGESARLRDRIAELGIRDNVVETGDQDELSFKEWIARTDVAVQLRAASNGETSGVVGRCLAAGAATIVTAIGAARELPDAAVAKVEKDVTPEALARTIVGLLRAPERRESMARSGLELVRAQSFERTADVLYERYVERARHAA